MISRLVVAGLLAAGLAVGAPALQAQETATRFEVRGASDSTFSFTVGRVLWVRPELNGIVVDPARRDALVARFRVLRVSGGVATGLITGQTTRVTTDHLAVLSEPRPRWYQKPTFWGGAVTGLVLGLLVGAL